MATPNKLRLVLPELPDSPPGPDTHPHKAGRVVLPADATTEEAYRATLLNCADHIARNIGAIAEARDHEGVHQARVGLRRVRVAVTSFGEAFRADMPEELSERAKVLARSLGVTRELDVFATDMLPPVEEAMPNLTGLGVLKLALEDVRARAWTDSVALLRSPLFTDFLRNLEGGTPLSRRSDEIEGGQCFRHGLPGDYRTSLSQNSPIASSILSSERCV